MRRSPYIVSQQLKEILCSYLETAYRISNSQIFQERSQLLRTNSVVSQIPYVETTPTYQTSKFLRDLGIAHIPAALNELAEIGLSVGKRPLYKHQEEAVTAAWDDRGNPRDLVVASGTGSGKTEIFYLTILADILREAAHWTKPTAPSSDEGVWSSGQWFHQRRHDTRPSGIRAIIMYPMNALVNDQLRRLRRTLASDASIAWQLANLSGNLIYFGRYTSQTMLPGLPESKYKRDEWTNYLASLRSGWEALSDELRSLGNWPRPDGPEMLGRWNMQAAPPDILLTNYSMLEYMLVRPIEASIFSRTREWLAQSKSNILTLVLDEAHTYSGARGTEVAFLIRRLYERLGVEENQIRCIATSASLGESPEELARVRSFVSGLFDRSEDRFTIVRAITQRNEPVNNASPSLTELKAFASFQAELEKGDSSASEREAVKNLLTRLSAKQGSEDYSKNLYDALESNPRINVLRNVTARSATSLDQIANKVWPNTGTQAEREWAIAGLLAAGTIARPEAGVSELPPLLPSRMHLMYRGLPGLWACFDPMCSEVETNDINRPCGKLYAEPRLWCDCGARVIELLSCRVCGLLIGGGIEENNLADRRIWPYEDNLEDGAGQFERYTVFSLENPGQVSKGHTEWAQLFRNTRTTAIDPIGALGSRVVWEPIDSERAAINSSCPRCGHRSTPSRTAIEPFRVTGAQAFSSLVEHAFRLEKPKFDIPRQEPIVFEEEPFDWFAHVEPHDAVKLPNYNPNRGRKALVFSDSRQNAARLAGDMVFSHYRDLFRQLLVDVLNSNEDEKPIEVSRLVEKLVVRAMNYGVDPTFGELTNFWQSWDLDRSATKNKAHILVETYLRREIADRRVGVEALGLARWVIPGVDENTNLPAIEPFSVKETIALLYSTLRIVSQENVIIPRSFDPEDWPNELVEHYYRKVIAYPPNLYKGSFVWEASRKNRLTRYLESILRARGDAGLTVDRLMKELWAYFTRGKIVISVSGNRPGFGIPISRFALAKMPQSVFVCSECKYVSAETVNQVCLRCHQECKSIPLEELHLTQNYYRGLSNFARDPQLPDPFPLRVKEHTAQISQEEAARRERQFQDAFVATENVVQDGVDILSVTTTMEMGIDIGDLTIVGLHNMPPTVASYQQRAGRAGRRSDGIAEVLTFSRNRSHDQYYYDRVADIVTGTVRIPTLHLSNQIIAQRHLNAVWLQRFFAKFGDESTTLLEAFGTVDDLMSGDFARLNELRDFLKTNGSADDLVSRILSGSSIPASQAHAWIEKLPEDILEVAQNASKNRLLLDLLIERGILPRYAFPVDVVGMWVKRPSQWNRGDEIQRDLGIALSEYAPGAEIVVDGKIYKSVGLFAPFEKSPHYSASGWFYECPNCHHIQFEDRDAASERPQWDVCPICQTRINSSPRYRVFPAIEPRGFRADWHKSGSKYRGGGQEKAGFSSPAQLVAGESVDHGELLFSDRLLISRRTGDLFVINRGPKGQEAPGFLICSRCGSHLDSPSQGHYDPSTGDKCRGDSRAERSVLLHRFNTDIVLCGVKLPIGFSANPTRPGGRAAWLSLGTALRRGAAAYLQIDPDELEMGIRPWSERGQERLSAEVFLYDTLPNGAGYAREVAENISTIIEESLRMISDCPANCSTACYRCLLEYGNQRQHGLLDRHLARDLLSFISNGAVPTLSEEKGAAALARLGSFAHGYEYEIDGNMDCPVFARVMTSSSSRSLLLIPTHTLNYREQQHEAYARSAKLHPVFVSEFDFVRRPFWVWDQIMPILLGESNKTDLF